MNEKRNKVKKPNSATSSEKRKIQGLPSISIISECQPRKKEKWLRISNEIACCKQIPMEETYLIIKVNSESTIKLQCHKIL